MQYSIAVCTSSKYPAESSEILQRPLCPLILRERICSDELLIMSMNGGLARIPGWIPAEVGKVQLANLGH